jgi:proline iminopeptidase
LAFLSGRGFHGLVGLLPIVVGAAYGAGYARRRVSGPVHPHGPARIGLYGRRVGVGLLTTGLVVLAVLVIRPARTAGIVGPDGEPLPGSVAELTTVSVGGHDQSIMIRGRSDALPVLLYLAGGPGGTDLGAMRIFSEDLERDFVVATWDQRGAGKSYPALDPGSTLTLERAVADTIDVTNYLRRRFDESQIYLVGNSWGTTLGVLAVQRHPELYYAFVGTGQMVSQSETDRMFYEDTVAWAQQSGQHALAAHLIDLGPPPYDDPWNYAAMLSYERQWNEYQRDATYDARWLV